MAGAEAVAAAGAGAPGMPTGAQKLAALVRAATSGSACKSSEPDYIQGAKSGFSAANNGAGVTTGSDASQADVACMINAMARYLAKWGSGCPLRFDWEIVRSAYKSIGVSEDAANALLVQPPEDLDDG